MGEKTGIAWEAVPTHQGYSVSTEGLIRGPSGRILRPMAMPDGHLYVLTPAPRLPRKLFVHRAVLLAFVGPCPLGCEGRHLNGNSSDNRLINLMWGDRYAQREDDRRNIVNRRGATKLTLDKVRAICASQGLKGARELARIYGVSHTTILGIWSGRLWANTGRLV